MPMVQLKTPEQASTAELVRGLLDESKELVKIEIALAKEEVKREVISLQKSVIAFGVGAVCLLFGAVMLLVSLALALGHGPLPALCIGLFLVAVTVGAGLFGYKSLPKKPLHETRGRLETDFKMLKEHAA
jgi:hypothetical protein